MQYLKKKFVPLPTVESGHSERGLIQTPRATAYSITYLLTSKFYKQMATSKTGGAFGYLRKSIAGMVYSAPKVGISQERVQVVRSKAASVTNPNTVAQIMQRMKLGAATRFYSAYEAAVNKGLMSHSWEQIKYGSASRLYFLQNALKKEDAVYVPNGITYFVPGEYLVSEGTIQSLPWRDELAEAPTSALLKVGTPLDAAAVTALSNFNVVEGDQITIMAAIHRNGRYFPACARVIVGAGEEWNYTAAEWTNVLNQVQIANNGIFAGAPLGELALAGVAVIISRGIDYNNDQRSTETFLLVNGYNSLRSPEALQAAIDSYANGTTFNSLNSDWYLNQGSGQAFDGRVIATAPLSVSLPEGETAVQQFGVGMQQSETQGGQIIYTIFTLDGTEAGQAVMLDEDGRTLIPATDNFGGANVLGSDLAAAMAEGGYGSVIKFHKITSQIAAQGGFTLGAA